MDWATIVAKVVYGIMVAGCCFLIVRYTWAALRNKKG